MKIIEFVLSAIVAVLLLYTVKAQIALGVETETRCVSGYLRLVTGEVVRGTDGRGVRCVR